MFAPDVLVYNVPSVLLGQLNSGMIVVSVDRPERDVVNTDQPA